MTHVISKDLEPTKFIRTINWLVIFFLIAEISIVCIQIFTNATPGVFEITKDLLFITGYCLSLAYLYRQVNDHYSTQEKVYIKLFKKNPHPMWVYDLTTLKFLTVNDAAVSLYGYSESEFLNMSIRDIRPTEDVPAIIDKAEKTKLDFNLNYHWSGVWRHKIKNGELRYVEISSHEIIFDGKKSELVLAYDVTERVNQDIKLQTLNRDLERNVINRTNDLLQLNQKLVGQNKVIKSANLELYTMTNKLQEANEKIQEHTDMKNKFISMASHEFRTPLSNIKFTTDLMKRRLEYDSREDMLKRIENIERQACHMTFVLDDVLTMGKTDSIKIAVNIKPVKIRDFISNIAHEVQCAVNSGSHKIHVSIDERVPEIIQSDEKLLRNVFINLLTNAIKYSPNHNLVEVSMFTTTDHIGVDVMDNGLGISTADIAKIFEPFYRVDSTKKIQGTGLGLSIVKRAADLIQAKIQVKSEINKGSVFTVLLPR